MTDEDTAAYPPPLDALLGWGEEHAWERSDWPDYVAELGLGPEHVADLIRMVGDDELNLAEGDDPRVWAPLHAWRALGQLRAEAAVEPLLRQLDIAHERGEDLGPEQIPVALGMIGRPALEPITRYLREPEHVLWAHVSASEALVEMAQRDPSTRDDAVRLLAERLERHAEQDATMNAFLILELVDLQAVETAALIERAFAADDVDLSVMGDWEDAQVELGLLEQRLTPRPRLHPEFDELALALADTERAPAPPAPGTQRKAAKTKRKKKLARQARRASRKRR